MKSSNTRYTSYGTMKRQGIWPTQKKSESSHSPPFAGQHVNSTFENNTPNISFTNNISPYTPQLPYAVYTHVEGKLAETRSGYSRTLLQYGPKDNLYDVIKQTQAHVAPFLTKDHQSSAISTLITPNCFITARHILNNHTLTDFECPFGHKNNTLELVEDGSTWGYDYVIIKISNYYCDDFSILCDESPPVEVFMQSYDKSHIYAYGVPDRTCFDQLQETTFLPTKPGFSGTAYRNNKGHIYGLHTKQCIEGTHSNQRFGILIKELPHDTILRKICSKPYDERPSIKITGPFSRFSTAFSYEIDEGFTYQEFKRKLNLSQMDSLKTRSLSMGTIQKSKIDPLQICLHKKEIPIIIEILEPNVDLAKQKITKISKTPLSKDNPIIFVIGLNHKENYGELDRMNKHAFDLANHLFDHSLPGICLPFVWKPTSPDEKSYPFPYLEARAMLTLHPTIYEYLKPLNNHLPIVRSIDSDVQADPLITGRFSCEDERQEQANALFKKQLSALQNRVISILSGGYRWNENEIPSIANEQHKNIISEVISRLNDYEFLVRKKLNQRLGLKSIYWPEPCTYIRYEDRFEGALLCFQSSIEGPQTQQKENTFYVKRLDMNGRLFQPLAPSKPLKDYFDSFFNFLNDHLTKNTIPTIEALKHQIKTIRQTHLNSSNVKKILHWHDALSDRCIIEEIISENLTICAQHIQLLFKNH